MIKLPFPRLEGRSRAGVLVGVLQLLLVSVVWLPSPVLAYEAHQEAGDGSSAEGAPGADDPSLRAGAAAN